MTSVKGYLQLLERSIDKNDPEVFRSRLQKVQNQVEKLNLLIADLLDFSKIESGKLKFNKKYFSLEVVLKDVLDVMQQSNPQVKLIKKGTIGEEIYGDEMRIEQVIVNLISNAIKYAPESEEIHINTEQHDDEIFLSVTDFGMGMSEEHQKKVFDKFYRIEETSERFQGLGIGLHICQEIIKRHNGKIGVNSAPNKGSEFYFYIPIHPNQAIINNNHVAL